MDFAFKLLFHTLAGMFVIGIIGCVVVIPVAAYQLFSVLFERDKEEEDV